MRWHLIGLGFLCLGGAQANADELPLHRRTLFAQSSSFYGLEPITTPTLRVAEKEPKARILEHPMGLHAGIDFQNVGDVPIVVRRLVVDRKVGIKDCDLTYGVGMAPFSLKVLRFGDTVLLPVGWCDDNPLVLEIFTDQGLFTFDASK